MVCVWQACADIALHLYLNGFCVLLACEGPLLEMYSWQQAGSRCIVIAGLLVSFQKLMWSDASEVVQSAQHAGR